MKFFKTFFKNEKKSEIVEIVKEKTIKEQIEEISVENQLFKLGISCNYYHGMVDCPYVILKLNKLVENIFLSLHKFKNENYEKVFLELMFTGLKYCENLLSCYTIKYRNKRNDFVFSNINKDLSSLFEDRIKEIINKLELVQKEYSSFILNQVDYIVSPEFSFFNKKPIEFEFQLRRQEFYLKIEEVKELVKENSYSNNLSDRILSFINSKENEFLFLEKGLIKSYEDKELQLSLLKRQEDIIHLIKFLYKSYVRYIYNVKEENHLLEITKIIE